MQERQSKNGDQLAEFAEQIDSREDYLSFLNELHNNLRSNADEWENHNLDDYLEALVAFGKDMPGLYRNTGRSIKQLENPSWRMFATMLLTATIYE